MEQNPGGRSHEKRFGFDTLAVHAGHGLDYKTAEQICALPEIAELNIGHFLVGEALFAGFDSVIKTFRGAMDSGRARARGQAA